MKVLQINSFFSAGGPPRIVKGIYDLLLENGHECLLAAGREKPIDGMRIITIGSPLSKYWHLFMSRVFDAQGLSSKRATKQLIAQIREYNPDVIQLHNLHGYYLNVEILFDFLKNFDKPVIWTLHDCWPITGHCAHFDFVGCEKWKTGCCACPQKKEYPRSDVFDHSKRNYDKKKNAFSGVKNLTVVTPSTWLAEILKQSFLGEYPVKVINNGIDLEVFKPADPAENGFRERLSLKNKTIVLGVAQNWGKKKGLDDFIELSKMLDESYQVVMVGLSKKQLNNLPPNIMGISQTNSVQELVQIYSAADVFVNLSVEETFGLVTVEALACGTPVIVHDKTAIPEVVTNSCGIVIKHGNMADIASAITDMKATSFTKEKCCEQAQLFDKREKYKDYLKLFKNVSC